LRRVKGLSETKEVTGSQLVTGIIGTIDVGSAIAKVAEYKIEENRTQEQLTMLKAWLEAQKTVYYEWWKGWAKKPITDIYDYLYGLYIAVCKDLADYQRSQLLMSAGGFPATASMIGLRAKYLASFAGVSDLTDAFLGIPQSIVKEKARQYWYKEAPWRIPDPELAFKLYMESQITRTQMNDYFAMNGWPSTLHDKLYNVFDTDPDPYTAFCMYKRGYIGKSQMFSCFKIAGFDEKWHDALFKFFEKIPTFYELMRLADYVPIDPTWAAEVLRANGYKEGDIPRYVTCIVRRPLREEVRSLAGRLLFEYANGRITRETLESELKSLGMLPEEISLWLKWGDKQYYDNVLDLQIDIIEQRIKKGNITTKEEAASLLKELGISEEIANLKAEKWYWQYMV
jgi:hypothetical protein